MTIKHLLENTRVKAALLILGGVFALALVVAGVKAVGNQVDSKILGYTNQQAQPFVITSNASGVATTTEFFGDVSPRVDGVYNLGSAAKRWANLFVSSITPSGSIIPSADNTYDVGSLTNRWRTGYFGTSLLTPSLIVSSTNAGLTLYNTVDQVTNYERGTLTWTGNIFRLATQPGGSGSNRSIQLAALNSASSGVQLTLATTAATVARGSTSGAGETHFTVSGNTGTQSSGITTNTSLTDTFNQSGTAGYTMLSIAPTETATGSGVKRLISATVGGTDRFVVDNLGNTKLSSAATTGIQLYNTADETTNFERGSIGFVSNVLTFTTAAGGSGTTRDLRFAPSSWEAGSGINISSSGGGICFICFVRTYSNANTSLLRVSGTNTASSNDSEALNLAVTVNQSGTAAYNVLDVNPTITSTGSGGVKLIRGAVGGSERFSVADTGKITLYTTVTAGGTTGAQTINKPSGCVNFAAAATSLVVTNSLVSASSIVLPSVQTNDTTLKSVQAVPTSGSFTLYASAAATGETKVCFVVMN